MAALITYLTSIAFEPSMLLQNLVTTGAVLILFAPAGTGTPHYVRSGLQFALAFLALTVMNGAWYILFQAPGSFFLTHLILLAGYVALQGKLKRKQYVIVIVLFYSIEVGMIILSSIIPEVLPDESFASALEIVLRNLVVLSTLAAAYYFRRCSILPFQNLTWISLVYAFIIGISTAVLAMVYSGRRGSYSMDASSFALLAFICILVIDFVAYYLNYSIARSQKREKQLVIESYMTRSDRELLRLNQQNLEDMRKIRHDIKNHFAYLEVLLREGRSGEALTYFRELQEDIFPQLCYIDCGNRAVSAILNLETAKARAQGLHLDYRCLVAPELQVRDSDLCALMTNLIDNAMEAMIRQGRTDGTVEVGLRQRENSLYLCVVNPIDTGRSREALLSLTTTKEDSAFHGYGHKIVEGIAAKYDGVVNRKLQDGRYIVDVVLDMPGQDHAGKES